MPNVIGEFVAKIGASTGGFNKGVTTAESKMGKFTKSFAKHRKAIMIGGAAMGAAIVAGMADAVKAFTKAGDEVQKMSLRTGFATDTLSEFKHAAEISGTSLNSLEKAVKRMQMQVLDANRGLKESIDNFKDMGISLDDLKDQSPEEQFKIMTEALAGVEDESMRAALASKVFGRAGTELLPMLANGAEGLANLRQEAHDLGIVFDQEAANKAASFTDTMHRMKEATDGLKFTLADELLPVFEPIVMGFTKLITKVGEFGKESKVLGMLLRTIFGGANAMYERIQENNISLSEEAIKFNKGEENSYKELLTEQIRLVKTYKDYGEVKVEDVQATKDWIAQAEASILAMDASTEAIEQQKLNMESYTNAIEANKKAIFDAEVAARKAAEEGKAAWTERMNQIMEEINKQNELNRARTGSASINNAMQSIGGINPAVATGGNTVIQNIQGSVLTERELGNIAQKGLLELDRFNYDTGIQ